MDKASTRTLFATAAATNSEATENCSDTRSMLNMGSVASASWKLPAPGAAYPANASYAMVGCLGRLDRYAAFMTAESRCSFTARTGLWRRGRDCGSFTMLTSSDA